MLAGAHHSSHVLQRLIRFSNVKRVLVVGPNILAKDPSTLFFANLFHDQPNSKVVMVDIQGKSAEVRGTFGGLYENIADLRSLYKRGVPLRFPTSISMDVRRMREDNYDLVFDHYTLPFISGAVVTLHSSRKVSGRVMHQALEAYLRAVKPGGKIVLLTDSNYVGHIVAWIHSKRLRHTTRTVDDKYHVWVPPEAVEPIRNHFQDAVHEVSHRMREGKHKIILRPTYACPFLITIRRPLIR